MKTRITLWTAVWTLLLVMVSCEKGYVIDEDKPQTQAQGNINLRVTGIELMNFDNTSLTRATTLSDAFSRLHFALFKDGEKVKNITQQSTDNDFGQVSLSLTEGTYQLVVLGHSGSGNATITDLEKITFPNNKVTDTFYYEGELTVGSSEQSIDLQLKRAVAMFRIKLTQPLASQIKQLKIYYTGGSSTFSAITGFGSVNSKQTELRDVTPDQLTYEVYTFPHQTEGELKVSVTAIDANGTECGTTTFEHVPVQLNMISEWTGVLFSDAGKESKASAFTVKADTQWGGTITIPNI